MVGKGWGLFSSWFLLLVNVYTAEVFTFLCNVEIFLWSLTFYKTWMEILAFSFLDTSHRLLNNTKSSFIGMFFFFFHLHYIMFLYQELLKDSHSFFNLLSLSPAAPLFFVVFFSWASFTYQTDLYVYIHMYLFTHTLNHFHTIFLS